VADHVVGWLAPFVLLFLGLETFLGSRPPAASELLDQAYSRGELTRGDI
jgi:hypothetical protein